MPSSNEFDASRLAPWTPLHGFSGHPQARERRGAVEVGDDPAAVVVGCRRHREPVSPGVEAHRRERGGDGGKALAEALEPGGVEPHVVGALFGDAP